MQIQIENHSTYMYIIIFFYKNVCLDTINSNNVAT